MGKPSLMHFPIVDSTVATLSSCETRREIKSKCEQSLTALQHGNNTEALQIMDETLSEHNNSALAHQVQGMIHVKLTALIEDPDAKQRHIKSAIDSAQRATELAPNSIEFAHFYASLLFDYMAESGGYELALAECERALCVENPVDPAEESLHVSEETAASTPEARISKVQEELRSLLKKCNLASISAWMRTLNDDKYRLIPVRSFTEQIEYRVPAECFTEQNGYLELTESFAEQIENCLPTEPDAPPPHRNNE